VVAEFVLERDIDRTWYVAPQIRRPPVGLVESPAHIEDRHRIAGAKELV
jgi:hypothetical protein